MRAQTPFLILKLIFVGSLILVAMGCTPKTTKPVETKQEDSFEVPPIAQPTTVGSLWEEHNGRAYMFEDLRASRIGDIVIVRIVEEHSGSKSANTTADRDSTYEGSLSGDLFGLSSIFPTALVGGVEVDASTKNEFEGSGSTSREDSLTGTIAARVVEVMPNGDLRVKGKREVTVNKEKQTMTLTGIVRRIDLDTQNTVMSTAIAEANIEYTGLGVVDDVQKPGWLVRVLDWVSPF